MSWRGKGKKTYALVGSMHKTLFAEQRVAGSINPEFLDVISSVQEGIDAEGAVSRLLANRRMSQGEVCISLSLHQFEIVNLSINTIPDEAVGKVIPFHLSKSLAGSIDDFIYDWQITKYGKSRLAISVILFPRAAQMRLCQELQKYKLTCKTLEPDIYSAAIFLEQSRRIAPEDVSIVVIVWNKSISVGVYAQEKFAVIRPIILHQPDEPFPVPGQDSSSTEDKSPLGDKQGIAGDVASGESQPARVDIFPDAPPADDILADFLISTKQDGESPLAMAQTEDEGEQESQPENPWQEYFNQIRLELMRTRDYYNSMIKGDAIRKVFIGCGPELFNEIQPILSDALEIQVASLTEEMEEPQQSDVCFALGVGALS
ncbi:MAG: hypothetical protein PF442_07460 [Desulfobulbaceae bacterium]|jgi:hypothetical protein|nr:hypothetical protein [Desulfobulbaceae bacterium]